MANENEERKEKEKKRNREYQRAWRQRQKDLKKKISKEEKEERKRKRHRENQRAYYYRKKGFKENDNVEELFQNKLDDLQMKRKELDSNEDQKDVVQCRASQNLENVQLEQNQFLTQQLRIYEKSHECITPKVILHRDTDIPGDGNGLFHSLIRVLQLQISTCDLRRQLCDSPYLNSYHNPQKAYSILSSNNEFGDLNCLYLFAKVYNQNICVHYHYFNAISKNKDTRFCHFKANDTHNWIHLDLRELHFTPYFSDDEKKKEDERKQKQKNKEYSKRYRDKKRTSNLQTGPSARDVLDVQQVIHTSQIAGPSTGGVDTSNVEPQIKEERKEHEDDPETDIPSFRINIEMEHEDEIKEEITIEENSFQCRICLSVRRRMLPLEKYEEIYKKLLFENYKDQEENWISTVQVCWECHAILRSVDRFQRKVRTAHNMLQSHQNDVSLSTLTTVVFSDSNPEIIYLIEEDKQTDQLNSKTDRDENLTLFRRVDFDLNGLKEDLDERRNEKSCKRSRFKCSTCILSFDDENELSEHNRECHDEAKKEKKKVSKAKTKLEKEYKGKIRLVTFTMEEMLEERRAEALKKNYLKFPYRCEYCITGFDHELALKSHMKARHDKKSNGIECKICNSILGTKISFSRHHKRHFRRYECIECGRRNNYLFSAVKHYNEKHGRIKTVFTCELCDFSTDTVHGQSSRVYSCAECGKQYRAKSGLAAHAATHAPSPAYCAECDAHFTSQLRLKSHLKRHSKHNERRFACNECDAIFKVKKSLQDHIELMHLNNTKHACNKCNKAFINSASLKTHREVVHEKKRPPRNKICDHCGRGFTSLSVLRSHIRTHTSERPLHCTHSPATFAHSAALYTHNKLEHSKT